jgi:cell division protein FtsQ
MKRIFVILSWSVLIAGLFVLLGFIEARHSNMTCCQFNVMVDYNKSDPLIISDEIKAEIIRSSDSIIGKPLENIHIEKIRQILKKNLYIASANIYTNIEGCFNIKIKQRKPIILIINKRNQKYYINEEGLIFPASSKYFARVLIANGNINERHIPAKNNVIDTDTLHGQSIHRQILSMARAIINDELLNAQIDQIYVNDQGEFELVPKLGGHLIIFGDINNMEEKFTKLVAFYKQGIGEKGWRKYKKINLKYENQIVCSK